jgi:hypothetical protein
MSPLIAILRRLNSLKSCSRPLPTATQMIARVFWATMSCAFWVWRFFFPL